MLNYDFYDIHAVLVAFRFDPSNKNNLNIANTIKLLIDSPQTGNTIETNIIRRSLVQINNLGTDFLA